MMHHYGGGGGGASSFSVFLSVPNHGAADMYSSSTNYASSSSSPSSVDCTLSLGTPSTRSSEFDADKRAAARNHHRRSAGSYVSNFCWDLLHPKHKTSGRAAAPPNNLTAAVTSGADPLLARRCANCDTTSTPLWRNGPRGPKSLCNACGIRFKKEERRAAAATVNSTAAESNHHHHLHHHPIMFNGNYTNSSTWVPQQSPTMSQKHPCLSAAIGNDEPENGISFLSWRLNVANTDHRPTLVHDFTR
ncbi:GATA transcription factor 18-like [Benincasa hispida]|uniref:GATA transcription factor 18-like n=1 Tax=Benincasa hispida TaxID=102211 RepID=UPI0018FF36A4|nr:GATA transcription factor 18-like [Benincasa hispida]